MIMSGSRRGVHGDTGRKFVANLQSLKAMSQFNLFIFYSIVLLEKIRKQLRQLIRQMNNTCAKGK